MKKYYMESFKDSDGKRRFRVVDEDRKQIIVVSPPYCKTHTLYDAMDRFLLIAPEVILRRHHTTKMEEVHGNNRQKYVGKSKGIRTN